MRPPGPAHTARTTRRRLLLALAGLPLAARQEPTFTSSVKVVNVLASVTTKKGEIIRDLSKDDFVLLEDGRPQTIGYFSRETDLPLTIGLMVDTSLSQQRVMSAERAASFDFLDAVLRENKDKVFITQFDVGVFVRQKLTSSRKDLEESLSLVDTQTYKDLQIAGAGTRMYDALVKVSVDIMTSQQGRKALILLTDGVDVGSDATLADAVEAVQKSETLVYSILYADAGYGDGNGRGGLERLARESGGSFFEVSKKRTIGQVYNEIQDELRSQYSIGYVSDQPFMVQQFRRIQLSTKQKGLIVRARDRYWARR